MIKHLPFNFLPWLTCSLYSKVSCKVFLISIRFPSCQGKRVYTLKKEDPSGAPTNSAHPARFSPDDKFSKERITCKKRFNILPTQQEPVKY